jgi:hypothetical protein
MGGLNLSDLNLHRAMIMFLTLADALRALFIIGIQAVRVAPLTKELSPSRPALKALLQSFQMAFAGLFRRWCRSDPWMNTVVLFNKSQGKRREKLFESKEALFIFATDVIRIVDLYLKSL